MMLAVAMVCLAVALPFVAAAPIPGLQGGVGRGFSIVTENMRAPIYAFSYNYGGKWKSPYDGNEYEVPDQLYATTSPYSNENKQMGIVESFTKFEHQIAKNWGVSADFKIKGANISSSFTRSKQEVDGYFAEGKANFGYEAVMLTFYSLDCFPAFETDFHPRLRQYAASLPQEIKSPEDEEKYRQFFDAYGTHVLTGGTYGGKTNFTTIFETSLYDSYSREWVAEQANLNLKWQEINAGLDSFRNESTSTVSHDFESSSHDVTGTVGGDPETFVLEGYEAWVSTIIGNPVYIMDKANIDAIHTHLSPILSQEVKKTMHQALVQYVNSGGDNAHAGFAQYREKLDARKRMLLSETPDVLGLDSGIGFGWDMVTERTRAPLYDWTYDDGQTWENTYADRTERVPDQLWALRQPSHSQDNSYAIMNSFETFLHTKESWMGVTAGFNVYGADIGLSFQQSKGEVDGFTSNNTRSFAIDNLEITYYQLNVWLGFVETSSRFTQVLSMLETNPTTDDHFSKWRSFFNMFGTHVITSADYGGQVNFTTTFDQSLLDSHSSEWCSQQIGLTVEYAKYKIGFDTGSNTTEDKTDHEFKEGSEVIKETIGGDPTILETRGYEAWVPTLVGNPALLKTKCEVQPIDEAMPQHMRSTAQQMLANYVTSGGESCKN